MVDDPDRPDGLAAKIVAAMDRLARAQRVHRQAVASRHGLSPLQVDLLATLADAPPPEPRTGLLARELGVAQPTISDSLRVLKGKDLLTSQPDPTDRRRMTLALTTSGQELVSELQETQRDLRAGVEALPEEDQGVALEVLLTLIARQLDAGYIEVARTCTTCRFHQLRADGGHRCSLLEVDLPPQKLRVNCPEHEVAARSANISSDM